VKLQERLELCFFVRVHIVFAKNMVEELSYWPCDRSWGERGSATCERGRNRKV
jgi:hypothetical protein